MKFTHLAVKNFRGLRDAESPLSQFVCAVGENNAGKSSLLQCLLLFITGTKLSKTDFYDPSSEILISVRISDITDSALANLTEEQRLKLEPFVHGGVIELARRYATDGTSKLRHITEVPKDKKYDADRLEEIFKGKKGKEISDTLAAFYPEVAAASNGALATTQIAAKEMVQAFVKKMPPEALELSDIALVTGIDNSIRALLPEPVYIPAVKDFSDDLKTKESASFGKLLGILLDVIEADLSEAAETFAALRRKLNRIFNDDGSVTDERMDRVKAIENTIQRNLQETFRNVSIELNIPPPEIKSVLSNANIVADDGVRGPIDNKGDGFKRAITFSILRSYVELSQDQKWRSSDAKDKTCRDKFLFLFEEPELYLHPRAQSILFEALALISGDHQVIVSTHSPLFVAAGATTTFIKVAKHKRAGHDKPTGSLFPIDLTDLSVKDKFQLISFETTNVAFFSRKIVLVEGDSDLIVFPHLAKTLNSAWDFGTSSTNLVKVNGKGSFKRYKEFFTRFDAEVALIADLDIVTRDFDKAEPSSTALELHSTLFQLLDRYIDEANALSVPPERLLREELQRERAARLHEDLFEARAHNNIDKQCAILDELFAFQRTAPRLELLRDQSRSDIQELLRSLLDELAIGGVYVLQRGAIEAYYPSNVIGPDKPTKAQFFCGLVRSAESINALCGQVEYGGGKISELEMIFRRIFETPQG